MPAWARSWGAIVALALVLTMFGPYGTFLSMDGAARTVFWCTSALGVAAMSRLIHMLLRRWPVAAAWPAWRRRGVSSLIASLPATVMIAQLFGLLSNVPVGRLGFWHTWPQVAVASLVFAVILGRRDVPEPQAPVPATPPSVPVSDAAPDAVVAFLSRACPRLAGARLLALAAEDHYLRIHTDQGDELVLKRLRDAIAELGEDRGAQVHRSFWVARDAVAAVTVRGQTAQLRLVNDEIVPVSRTALPRLRAAGWLTDA